MENTLENKQKFFAQYYGQPILSDVSHGFQGDNEANNWHQLFENNYLDLKKIDSITDKDSVLLGFEDSADFFSNGSVHDMKDDLRLLGYAIDWADVSVEEQIEFGWTKLRAD